MRNLLPRSSSSIKSLPKTVIFLSPGERGSGLVLTLRIRLSSSGQAFFSASASFLPWGKVLLAAQMQTISCPVEREYLVSRWRTKPLPFMGS